MFPWKGRSEIPLTDVNGKVRSDLMVTKGQEIQRSPNQLQQRTHLKGRNCSSHSLPHGGTPGSSLAGPDFPARGRRTSAPNLFSIPADD